MSGTVDAVGAGVTDVKAGDRVFGTADFAGQPTVSDFAAAAELGVRSSLGEGGTPRYDVLAEFAAYAANGKFAIPVAGTFPLTDWRTALEISETGHARGKLVLLPDAS